MKDRKQQKVNKAIEALLRKVNKKKAAPMPEEIAPMLATLTNDPVEGSQWLYEVKWDGFRTMAFLQDGAAELRSRNNKVFNDKFYPVHAALQTWKINAILDGEVVVVNANGLPDFEKLQSWRSEADGKLMYFVFDILWLEGYDLMQVPLVERRNMLLQIIPEDDDTIRMSESFETSGGDFFKLAEQLSLEGIMAKKASSIYAPGKRTKDWLKVKTQKFQEVIIAGYTVNTNISSDFSALIMAILEAGELRYLGTVGTGFSARTRKDLLKKMQEMETDSSPFKTLPELNRPTRFRPDPPKVEVHWLKPRLVAEISFRTVGPNGAFRHPSFKGLRTDKEASEVVWETPVQKDKVTTEGSTFPGIVKPRTGQQRRSLLNPSEETQVRKIDGHELRLPNLSKVYWPEERYTKRDMLNYYYQIVPYMLPYMKDRPQTLNRHPNGIYHKGFYQKDVTGKIPEWLSTYPYFSDNDEKEKHFLVCTDEASLLYIASLGCIEMNPWSSTVNEPDKPDWCIIDLDPSDSTTFDQVIEAARVTKEVLDELGLPSFCKTSGSTGMHIYVPLGAKYTYEYSREFGRAIATMVHQRIPKFTSIQRYVSKRKGKMYIDFLQNRPQATVAAPYSLRPKPGATVSMPLHWDEVKPGLRIHHFTIKNAVSRVQETGDLFEGVLGPGIDLMRLDLETVKSLKG